MTFKILAISGDGIGAGKTTLANRLAPGKVRSLAAAMRTELEALYPAYDWFNKTQEYKANTLVKEFDNKTVRQVLIEYGQTRCDKDSLYWVRKLSFMILAEGCGTYAIDDVRKTCEIDFLRVFFGSVSHLHIAYEAAQLEPMFENEALRSLAEYIVEREDVK